ncbi:MAG: class I SAM-dependent methyltransferase [Rhodospirillaceae bacterium]|jgi:ubiquinone/menaquinone biosynthesis C-methylase UbiE|nr:class I SAM-dependent methyltransferase [Rhodospirillaceae bacterium]MBT5566380.1 class I SAM-dependent methyltransferase [Rhodospirillaceae bacterium]MBT6088473.1 class I SAM-dependent methyltransferase [Rhodospirillaceae bacterium]MBT6962081.1 class I SAM-dependent methyltransferase [Rhodospirillaceae bacterium]
MARNPVHTMLASPNHDELARQQYTLSLKDYVRDHVRARNEDLYEYRAKPRFVKEHGREPESVQEIGTVMWDDPAYQMFSRMHRDGQEMMWASVADTLYREQDRLSADYTKFTQSSHCKGTLELDPDFDMPRAMADVDIHLQPGGYCSDYGDDDVLAGAFYEYGGNLYTMGRGVGVSESKGEVGVRFLKERYPDFTPTRILDIGCSAGSSTVPYVTAFSDADVHGIDVAASILRYAHARAEAMGKGVHFHQRDAANTGFEDKSFDLVMSHNAMHEFSQSTTEDMMRENFRLLKPGGVAMHMDVNIRYDEYSPWMQFHRGWDQVNNNEPFWRVYATNNPSEMLRDAGFPEESVWQGKFQQLDNSLRWFIATARKG